MSSFLAHCGLLAVVVGTTLWLLGFGLVAFGGFDPAFFVEASVKAIVGGLAAMVAALLTN
jgi:hypothetical protein